MNDKINKALWIIYVALLAVLLPHTAWAFGQFEPQGLSLFKIHVVGWVGALAFEGAIAALTWRLKEAIETAKRANKPFLRFWRKYGNVYSIGLLVAIGVSSAANWAHAEEFGRAFAVFARYSIPSTLYSVAFGGILPLCSLLFAHVLAKEQESEKQESEALTKANDRIKSLKDELAEMKHQVTVAEVARNEAEQRFAAAGEIFVRLMAEDKRERILAAYQLWPELPQRHIAYIAGASDGYVSEVITEARQIEPPHPQP